MRRYIARELLQLVVVIIGISILAFVILHVLGDPVLLLLPQNAGHEEFERYQKLLGLDQPIWLQYWKFGSHAIQGDFGKSWYADTPAFALVLERMPPTIYLTLAGLVVAVLIALPLGILAALKRHTFVDNLCTALAGGGQALPIFWLGIMLIIIFPVRLRALPASGYGTWQHFVMPAFCLGAALAPITMRLVRSGVIEVMNMEYIKTARAKGVGERMVVVKHAFRNACIPIITVLGLQFGQLLGGAIKAGLRTEDDSAEGYARRDAGHDRRRAHGTPGIAPPSRAPPVGSRRERHPARDRGERDLRPRDRAPRSARREHQPPAGPAGLDGGRDASARAGHRPGRARSPLTRDLRRTHLARHRRRRGADLHHHRRAPRARRRLLRRARRLDDHDGRDRAAILPVRARGALRARPS